MNTSSTLLYAIDLGNSSSKVSLWNEEMDKWEWTQEPVERLTLDEAKSGAPLVVCSVSNKIPRIVSEWTGPTLSLGAETNLPFNSEYDRNGWGSDRMAAVAGAFYLNPKADCLIIDAGTCVTFDYLDSIRGHLAGPISPGLNLRAKAMNAYTGRLPLVTFEDLKPNHLNPFPKTTQDALILGALGGWNVEIKKGIERFKKQKPEGIVYLTGGDSRYFEANPKNRIFAAPLLVFEGMVHLWKWNRTCTDSNG